MGESGAGKDAESSRSAAINLTRQPDTALGYILVLSASGGMYQNLVPLATKIDAARNRHSLSPGSGSGGPRRDSVVRAADFDREFRYARTIGAGDPGHRNPHHRLNAIG